MLNLTGQTIGRLEVIFEAPSIKRAGQQGRGSDRYWFCLCECGNMVAVRQECLRGENPKTRSCGCLQKEEAAARQLKGNGESAFNKLLASYVKKAEKKHRLFLLTIDEFKTLTKGDCHYCGKPPSNTWTQPGGQYIYNGVDRINSQGNYEQSNCVSCCWVCNFMKNDLSVEAFLNACYSILKHCRPDWIRERDV